MEVGSWVKVHGLVGAPEHNGKYGVAKSFAGESGRYKVLTETGGTPLGLKLANVELVEISRISLVDLQDSILALLPVDSIRTLGRLLRTHRRFWSLRDEAMRLTCGRLYSVRDPACVRHAVIDSDHPLVGQAVTIQGLKAKPELNGATGSCTNFNATSGRYSVSVDGGIPQRSLNVKPSNLKPIGASWKTMLQMLTGPRLWTRTAPGVSIDMQVCSDSGGFNGPWLGRAQDTHVSIAISDPRNPTTSPGYHPVTCGDVVMCSGRHYIEFDNPGGNFNAYWMAGIMPADYDPTTLDASMKGAHKEKGGLLVGMWHPVTQGVYRDGLSVCFRSESDLTPEYISRFGPFSPLGDLSCCDGLLEGMGNAQPNDEVLGLLLDLDEGSLAIYRQHAG
jgi:hypothetical protein